MHLEEDVRVGRGKSSEELSMGKELKRVDTFWVEDIEARVMIALS